MLYRLFYSDTHIDVKAISIQSAVRKAHRVLGIQITFERHEELKKQKNTN